MCGHIMSSSSYMLENDDITLGGTRWVRQCKNSEYQRQADSQLTHVTREVIKMQKIGLQHSRLLVTSA